MSGFNQDTASKVAQGLKTAGLKAFDAAKTFAARPEVQNAAAQVKKGVKEGAEAVSHSLQDLKESGKLDEAKAKARAGLDHIEEYIASENLKAKAEALWNKADYMINGEPQILEGEFVEQEEKEQL